MEYVDMASSTFSSAELSLQKAFPTGSWVGPCTAIRAEVIRELLLGTIDRVVGTVPAVRLRGAHITNRLDLMGAAVDVPLICDECTFDTAPRFVESSMHTVRITKSQLPGFNGARMQVSGILNLAESQIEHGLWLDRVRVIGEISLGGTSIQADRYGVALTADGMSVDGNVEFNAGFHASGEVRLRGARITGALILKDATIRNPGGKAIHARGLAVGGLFTAKRLITEGEFRLANGHVNDLIDFTAANLSNPGGIALGGRGLIVGGAIWCGGGFRSDGEIRLRASKIGDNITLSDAIVGTLELDRAEIGDLDATGLSATGELSLAGATVAGNAYLDRVTLAEHARFNADGLHVNGSASFISAEIDSDLTMRTAHVGGHLLMRKARIKDLRLSRAQIGADLFADSLQVGRTLKLTGTRVEHHIDLGEATVPKLLASRLVAAQATLPAAGHTIIDLQHAQVGLLRSESCSHELHIDGLAYQALEPHWPARKRLAWLASQIPPRPPQPYEELAAMYNRIGEPKESRRVLYARERNQLNMKPLPGHIWSRLQDLTVGYGYLPWRAALWLFALLVIGSVTYFIAPPSPLNPAEAPHFNSIAYTLDLLLPIVDLGQQSAFNPDGPAQWLSYFLIASGWILATTITAGIARVLTAAR